jgi:non-ribosomal peptide synthetase component E (peptide arylation enzyme)
MILGEGSRTAGTAATLDDIFRRAGVSHPDALALADPPNRQDFTDGMPRILSFAQADRAISAFAARLRGFGLQTDTIVALQLPTGLFAPAIRPKLRNFASLLTRY